jgi:surface antigen
MGTPWWRRTLSNLSALALLCGTLVTGVFTAGPALAGTDDYPAQWRNAPMDSVLDSWGEWNRECTSDVASLLHSVSGFGMPFHDGAANWGPDASNRGYAVNSTPAVGSVYWTSAPQHVARVESVNSGGTFTIEDYNSDYTGRWGERTVPATSATGYIHFHDLTGGTGSSGSTASSPQQITFDAANNTSYMAVQGPGNTLALYWNAVGSTIQGPPMATSGAGQDVGTPSIAVDPANNTLYMTSQEPSGALGLYWNLVGSTVQGPLVSP